MRGLAALGKDLNLPVLVLAQLNRGVEARANKRPQLSDLRDSGSIEEIARIVLFLYRDGYYNELTEQPNVAELEIAKQNDGPTGAISLYWNGDLAQFKNLARQEAALPASRQARRTK